jgi:hypothetical protein
MECLVPEIINEIISSLFDIVSLHIRVFHYRFLAIISTIVIEGWRGRIMIVVHMCEDGIILTTLRKWSHDHLHTFLL